MMSDDAMPKKPRGRPFSKGESGNPSGRPKGARNRSTLLAEALVEKDAEEIVQKCIDDAKGNDRIARRFIVARVLPAQRERPARVEIGELQTGSDIKAAINSIIRAINEAK